MKPHSTVVSRARAGVFVASFLLSLRLHGAPQSIDYVAEHLPEIAMDNRYASLPLWANLALPSAPLPAVWRFGMQGGYARTQAGTLRLEGPMLSFAVGRQKGDAWQWSAFAFIDAFQLSSGAERRALDVTFVAPVPLDLPAQAEFSGLAGSARHIGIGLAARRQADLRLWGRYAWSAGLMWQRFALHDYALDFRVLDGANARASGRIDYSAAYSHITPFAGLAWPRDHGAWRSMPHLQVAWPLPRRGVAGRITGPAFDLRGDTATNARGTHFGDPSLTVGWDFTYRPLGLTVDVGTVVSQALLERVIHKGAGQNWVLSLRWDLGSK